MPKVAVIRLRYVNKDYWFNPAGLPVEEAVRKLCYLVENALVRRLSGVDLKDDVPPGYLPFAETRALG